MSGPLPTIRTSYTSWRTIGTVIAYVFGCGAVFAIGGLSYPYVDGNYLPWFPSLVGALVPSFFTIRLFYARPSIQQPRKKDRIVGWITLYAILTFVHFCPAAGILAFW